jgi:hypothetical protein
LTDEPNFYYLAGYRDEYIQKNPIGLVIRLTVREKGQVSDISSATTKEMIFQRPDGTALTTSASFVTDGTDGKIYYKTVSGDLDQAGIWYVQSYIAMPDFTGDTSIVSFVVNDNLT